MENDEQVLDAVARWQEARERGETLEVAQICQDCPELISRVRERIEAIQRMDWLENSDGGSEPPPQAQAQPKRPSTHDQANEPTIGLTPGAQPRPPEIGSYVRYVGDYELLAEIARGGMGVVFKARQVRLKRVVALKMILAGRLASENEVRRFQMEAEAAANLEHPHIVPIFEVGEQKGLHYFSMGYVDGLSLAVRLADGPLPAREAATILRPVAEAVHYAHQKGVIHRDLKPGNILIDKQGQPRVTDFGLAKRVSADASEMTGSGQILGTASYMPPEQALGQPSLVREPADIYSLGAVLYAMLTGRPPFQADNPVETLRQVIEREPVPPRQLNPAIPADLETICLKCLEKAAARRYATAQELADELGRYLDGKPILARPVSTLNRAWRWCKRNRTVASLLTAVAASLVIGTVVSAYFAREANQRAEDNLNLAKSESSARKSAESAIQREQFARKAEQAAKRLAEDRKLQAEATAKQALRESANLALNEARHYCERGEANIGLLWMVRGHELAHQCGDADLADAARATISGWLHQVPRKRAALQLGTGSHLVGFGAEHKTVITAVVGNSQKGVRIYSVANGEEVDHIPNSQACGSTLAIHPDGSRILIQDAQGHSRLWSINQRQWLGEPLDLVAPPTGAEFSPDGKLLATITSSGDIQIWSGEDGSATGIAMRHETRNSARTCSLCFSPDSKTLYTTNGHAAVLAFWDPLTGKEVRPRLPQHNWMQVVAVSPTEPLLAMSSNEAVLKLFRLDQEPPQQVGYIKTQYIDDLQFSADGKWIVEAGHAGLVHFRSTPGGNLVGSPIMIPTAVLSARMDRANHRVAIGYSGGADLWETPRLMRRERLLLEPWNHYGRSAHHRLRLQANGQPDKTIRVRRTDRDEVLGQFGPLPDPPTWIQFDPLGKKLVCLTQAGDLFVIELETAKMTPFPENADAATTFFISPGGDTVVSASGRGVQFWSLHEVRQLGETHSIPVTGYRQLAITKSGDVCMVLEPAHQKMHFFRVADGTPLRPPVDITGPSLPTAADITLDGREFVVGRGRKIEVWDVVSGQKLREFGNHNSGVSLLKFPLEGNFLMSAATTDGLRLWDYATGAMIGTHIRESGRDRTDTWNDATNGRLIATYTDHNHLNVWHVRTGRQVAPRKEIPVGRNGSFLFDADGTLVHYGMNEMIPFPRVPENHDQLRLFIETWTGLAQENGQLKILTGKEWRQRQTKLQSSGWSEPGG